MATLDQFRASLATRRLAIAGVCQTPNDFSRLLFREFLQRGCDVVPVHPAAGEIEGRACFARLQEVISPVEAVLLMTSPTVTERPRGVCRAGEHHFKAKLGP